LPEVISFDQNPPEVFRTEVIHITATGMDVETIKENLGCIIYYQEPDSNIWHDLSAEYNESSMTWQSQLVTTRTFVPGNYSFKVQLMDSEGASSRPIYANHSVWVRNNPPMISDDLNDIHVGTDPLTVSLTDYGYDIETSKSDLIWSVDLASVDRRLFQVKTGRLGEQELVIDPVPSKTGRDDITIILSDGDFGHAIKTNLTITIDSRTESEKTPEEEDSAMAKLASNSSLLFIYVLIIIVFIIVILFIFYRRKKRKEEEEKKEEVTKADEQEKRLQPTVASPTPLPEAVPVESTPVIEQRLTPTPVPMPEEAVAVPMPVEAPKPQLPVATEVPLAEPIAEQLTPRPQPVPQPEVQIDNSISNRKPPQGK
jgi:cbb3-type cytochrome oxidase subunit 3